MHFWATLEVACSGCHSDLVSPVRGARDAPSMKSVSYHAVCSVISVSSDVKVLWMSIYNQTGPILVHIYPLFNNNLHVKYRSNLIRTF